MQAIQIDRFGPPDVLHPVELDDPVPGAGQVVIDVEFPSITFVETQLRAGRPPAEAMRPQLPVVLGNGVAGVVDSVGRDVEPQLVGARVVSGLSGRGGYAERAVADASRLVRVPDGLGLDDAAALLADGRTALALLAAVGEVAGRTVLVEAAAGGVGGLLVQLVSAAGARVVGVASSVGKLEVARSLGADFTVDYSEGLWTEHIREAVGPVDVVFDGVGARSEPLRSPACARWHLLPVRGRSRVRRIRLDGRRRRADVHTAPAGAIDVPRQVGLATDALTRAASGELRATVGRVFDLADAAAAHAAIESRSTIGKTLMACLLRVR